MEEAGPNTVVDISKDESMTVANAAGPSSELNATHEHDRTNQVPITVPANTGAPLAPNTIDHNSAFPPSTVPASPSALTTADAIEHSVNTLAPTSAATTQDVEMQDAYTSDLSRKFIVGSVIKLEDEDGDDASRATSLADEDDAEGEGEGEEEEMDEEGEAETEEGGEEDGDIVTDFQRHKRTRKQLRRKKGWSNITPAQKRMNKIRAAQKNAQFNASLESTPAGSPGPFGYDEFDEEASKEGLLAIAGSARTRPVLSHLVGRAGGQAGSSSLVAGAGGGSGSNPHSPLLPPGFPRPNTSSVEAGQKTEFPSHPLSKPFALYEAPKPRNYEDEENEEAKAAAAALAKRKAMKGRAKEEMDVPEDEQDDRLYCVCKELYDAERTMIACDKCENWYHLDCVHIREHMVELVDWFFCPPCTKAYEERTTWKPRCARPTCLHAVAPLSKFCSDFCGLEMAVTRLEVARTDPERYWGSVSGARRRAAQVLDVDLPNPLGDSTKMPDEYDEREEESSIQGKRWNSWVDSESMKRQEREDLSISKALQRRLGEVDERRRTLDAQKRLVEMRLTYLQIAIRRWEALCQATADALGQDGMDGATEVEKEEKEDETTMTAEMAAPKRRNTKGKAIKPSRPKKPILAINLPEAQCGFDARIVLDNEQWEEWIETDEAKRLLAKAEAEAERGGNDTPTSSEMTLDDAELQDVCMWPRKECPRHQAWQKVREADFQVERAVIERRMDRLALQESRLRAQVADHAEALAFRARCREHDPIAPRSVAGQIKSPIKRTPSKKRLARSLFTGEDPFPEARQNPWDLFPGLERLEAQQQAQMPGGDAMLEDGGKGKRVKIQKKK